MRVTNNLIFGTLERQISGTQERLLKTYETLSSMKKVSRPSDDPVITRSILDYKKAISNLEQYKRNIQSAEEYLANSEASLSNASNTLSRLRELAVQEASGTATAETRKNASVEVGELYNELIAIGNTRVGNRYLFSGYKYTTQPFDTNGNYSGDSTETSLKIGPDSTFTYGFTGDRIFKGVGISGGVDIYTIVSQFKTALENNDTSGIQDAIEGIDNAIDQIDNIRAEMGARLTRLNSQRDIIDSFTLEAKAILSGMEDADIADVSINLSKEQTALEALLLATAKVTGLNIFNFIR